MELSKLQGVSAGESALIIGALFVCTVAGFVAGDLTGRRRGEERMEPSVTNWQKRADAAKSEADAAIKRAYAAEVDRLKAQLAAASCDKRAAEWERRAREKGE